MTELTRTSPEQREGLDVLARHCLEHTPMALVSIELANGVLSLLGELKAAEVLAELRRKGWNHTCEVLETAEAALKAKDAELEGLRGAGFQSHMARVREQICQIVIPSAPDDLPSPAQPMPEHSYVCTPEQMAVLADILRFKITQEECYVFENVLRSARVKWYALPSPAQPSGDV